MTCPICLDNKCGSWVKCPRYGLPVCQKHCSGCEYFSGYETSVVHCFYGNKLDEDTTGEECGVRSEECNNS